MYATHRTRKYGRSCLTCRKRKVRCDASKPECITCRRAGESCVYKADDRTAALENQLEAAEVQVQALQGRLRGDTSNSEHVDSPTSSQVSDAGFASALTIDESGQVDYYGATSRFHQRSYDEPAPALQEVEQGYHRKWLKSNARFQPTWEARAYERLGTDLLQLGIDAASARLLMDIYWTWQAPLHNCIYRRCFFRDMAMGGPYFSLFLLNVIFAHACRHTRKDDVAFSTFEKGEFFLRKAKVLLVEELELPKIPTVQGLLILGGRQCAIGKSSEGWLYTGMAIAMIKDIGLHLPKSAALLMSEMEPDDLEARKRLYMSAYTWDKSIGLCLGRPPQLRETPHPNSCFLDDSDDAQEWRPMYLLGTEQLYPRSVASHTTMAFAAFCELAGLVDTLYETVYGAVDVITGYRSARTIEQHLRRFHDQLPAQIRADDATRQACSPPPHILCLNVLYHTLLILLYRPFSQPCRGLDLDREAVDHARQICAEEAAVVNAHFQAYGRTFNYLNQTYLLSYCVYTAATIEVQLLRDKDIAVARIAADRLATTLSMLEVEAEQTPGIRRSVDFIKSQVGHMPPRQLDAQLHQSALPSPSSQYDSTCRSVEIGTQYGPTSPNKAFYHSASYAAGELSADGSQQYDVNNSCEDESMPWFDWNSVDISGGFPLFDGTMWKSQMSMWPSSQLIDTTRSYTES